MKKDLLHTPEGVRDIYGKECRERVHITEKLRDVCERFGYSCIQTPTFEFFDVFNSERGSVPSNEMFKFFDHHGDTLVLRPDMTPSVARTAAKYFADSLLPVKLYYVSNTFINHENAYRGQLKENTVVGAELIGSNNSDEDLEIICMAVECMKSAGLTNFQVEIGNSAFFKGLLKEAGIEGESEERLVSLINKKNYFGVEELITEMSLDKASAEALMAIPALFGTKEVLDKARLITKNSDCLRALDRLSEIYEKLKEFGYEKYVSFDLGSLSNHAYYTGIIFHAYSYGSGEALLSGGRYDNLIAQFGADKPSIGFSIIVDRLAEALSRQKIEIPEEKNGILLVYDEEALSKAQNIAFRLRNEGKRVGILSKQADVSNKDYALYSSEWNFVKTIILSGDKTSLLINEDGTAEPIVTSTL